MFRRIAFVVVAFTLVLEVRSATDNVLKCYMCTSVTEQGCDADIESHKLKPVECTFDQMRAWQTKIKQHKTIAGVANLFEVDNIQNYQGTLKDNMACAKMDIKLGEEEVTVRSCQTAKAENIDPCKSIKSKLPDTLMYCGLCERDGCNGSTAPSPRIFYTILSLLGTLVLATLYQVA